MAELPVRHARYVALPPCIQPQVVIISILSGRPAIKRFVHDQHSETVTCIEERRASWAVAGANCIVPVCLEQLHSPLFCLNAILK